MFVFKILVLAFIFAFTDANVMPCTCTCEAPIVPTPKCPDGFKLESNGACYKFFSEAVAWHKAEANCQDLGANLVTIHSAEENKLVRDIAAAGSSAMPTRMWIGLHDLSNEGDFEWIDGSPCDYTNWDATYDEPNDYGNGEDCTEMYVRIQNVNAQESWNDLRCPLERTYMCKK